jgi:hypothetical protein
VAGQLVDQGVIAPGSDGTTVTVSDMQALTALSAVDQGIMQLDGLQYAANLTSLDLGGNGIATITPLAGLTNLTQLDASGNELDLAPGSPAMSVISALKGCGTHIAYRPQRAVLSRPFVPASAAKYGKSVTFTADLAPRSALTSGTAELRLYHLETKTVTRETGGVYRRVKVNYWRLRSTLAMRAYSAEVLCVQAALRRQVASAGHLRGFGRLRAVQFGRECVRGPRPAHRSGDQLGQTQARIAPLGSLLHEVRQRLLRARRRGNRLSLPDREAGG